MRLDDGQIEVLDDAVAELLQSKSSSERLNIANGMWKSAMKLIAATLRTQHPEWDETHIAAEVSHRLAHGSH
jgi:hypothetical protein